MTTMDSLDQEIQEQYRRSRSDIERVDLMNQHANDLYRQEQYERARALSLQAFDLAGIAGENQQPYARGLANSLTLLGNIDLDVSPGDQLLGMFSEAVTLLDQEHDLTCLAEALRGISWVYFCSGDYASALDYINRAMDISEESQNLLQKGRSLTTAGAILAESNDLEQAVQMLQSAIQILSQTSSPRELSMAYNNLAMTYVRVGKLAEAEAAGLVSLKLIEPLNTAVSEAAILDTLGLVYDNQGNLDLAAEYFRKSAQRAQAQISTGGADMEPYLHLGEVLLKTGSLPEAEQNLRYALLAAEKYGLFRLVFSCHEKLAELYEQTGNFQKSLNHYRQFHLLREKVFGQENIQQLTNLKAMHKVESALKDAEILRLRNAGLVLEIASEKARHVELEHLATTDSLTELFNRRHFFTLGAFEFSNARLTQTELCLIILDVDHFKTVNDEYGHLVGDQVLVQLSATLSGSLRSEDLIFRYGGEEFVVLLPNTDLEVGLTISNRLVNQVAEMQVPVGSQVIQITISAGVASLKPDDLVLEQLLAHADYALRQAKLSGRNRALAHPGSAYSPSPRS